MSEIKLVASESRPINVNATARYKGNSKKGTYHVFNVACKYGVVGTIYFPKEKHTPEQVTIEVCLPGTKEDQKAIGF